MGIHRNTVGRVLKKFQEKGSVENNRRSGRPRVTDARGDRKIYRIVKRNRRQSLQDITSKFNGDEGTQCRRELFVGDCTRKVTGEGRFRKL